MKEHVCTLSHGWRFEAGHRLPHLPAGHKCTRQHGHGYRVTVRVRGPVQTDGPFRGMVMDTDDIRRACLALHAELDHRYLPDIAGLENSTFEVIAKWIYDRLAATLPLLASVTVRETHTGSCTYRGPRA